MLQAFEAEPTKAGPTGRRAVRRSNNRSFTKVSARGQRTLRRVSPLEWCSVLIVCFNDPYCLGLFRATFPRGGLPRTITDRARRRCCDAAAAWLCLVIFSSSSTEERRRRLCVHHSTSDPDSWIVIVTAPSSCICAMIGFFFFFLSEKERGGGERSGFYFRRCGSESVRNA